MNTAKRLKSALLRFGAGLLLVSGLQAQARAQQGGAQDELLVRPQPAQGYYYGVSLFMMGMQVIEDGDNLGTWAGRGGSLKVGQMVTPLLGLGLTVDFGGVAGEAKGRDQLGNFYGLAVEGQYRPMDRLGLFAASGIGVAILSYKEKLPDDDDALRGGYGARFSLGASWDFYPYTKDVSGGLALSPTVRMHYFPADSVDAIILLVGVDVTWWSGLPKNQLDLPPDKAFD